MNELTQEWLQKADNDFLAATLLLQQRLESLADAVCFHCQQCAEKYSKAYLQKCTIEFPRTHNLAQLLSLCAEQDETFAEIAWEMRSLNSYSVEVRYPGRFTSLEEGVGAVEAMKVVRNFIRAKIQENPT